jgi:DNA-binding LytR/AlgR family response regulator
MHNTINRIIIKEGKKLHFINGNEIVMILAEGYYSIFYLNDRECFIRISLKELEDILPQQFLRINKSAIINFDHVLNFKQFEEHGLIKLPNNEFKISEKHLDMFISFLSKITRE